MNGEAAQRDSPVQDVNKKPPSKGGGTKTGTPKRGALRAYSTIRPEPA